MHPAGVQLWTLPSVPPQDVTPFKQSSLSLAVAVATHTLFLAGTPLAHDWHTLLFPVAQDHATTAPTQYANPVTIKAANTKKHTQKSYATCDAA